MSSLCREIELGSSCSNKFKGAQVQHDRGTVAVGTSQGQSTFNGSLLNSLNELQTFQLKKTDAYLPGLPSSWSLGIAQAHHAPVPCAARVN